MRQKILSNYIYIFCLLVIILGVAYRILVIGHNNFTGDELNTVKYLQNFYSPLPDISSFYTFLLSQPRGPLQNIVTYLTFNLIPFRNELIVRFPFSVFSVVSLVVLYFFVKRIFSIKVAFIACSVFAMNGLMIIFGQVAQYQSIVIFCILLSMYFFDVGYKTTKYRYFIISAIILSVGLLAHLDMLGILFFYIGYFLYKLKNKNNIKFNFVSNSIFWFTALIFSSLYYVPYFLNHFDSKKQDYLQSRVFGSGFMPQTPYMNLGKILTLYMPDFYWIGLFVIFVLGLLILFKNNRNTNKLSNSVFFVFLSIFVFAFIFSFFPIKPRLSSLMIYLSSFSLLFLFYFFTKVKPVIFALIFYSLTSFCLYFFFMKDPRTHVYISLVPIMIIVAYGFYYLLENKFYFLKLFSRVLFIFLFIFLITTCYIMFFDKQIEYPWNKKNLFGYNFRHIDRTNVDSKISGVFGFGGNRHWLEIRRLLDMNCLKGSFGTNENKSILLFYLNTPIVTITPNSLPDNFIFIFSPNSWSPFSEKMLQSEGEYVLLKEYFVEKTSVTKIYGRKSLYPASSKVCFN